jgi:[acyl-carrier-protein] S-malonyltransferase
MRVAFVFPGQGSQSVGMLRTLAEASGIVRATFAEASAALQYDLWKLTQEGPAEELNRTECTQPAMLAAGVATFRFWREAKGRIPDCVCGHSLGEFTALVCADAIEFAAAVKLVAFRGRAMQEAVPVGSGAMAAILGLEDQDVLALCQEASDAGVVEAVNFNSPSQVVIAGARAAVERAMALATERGAKRVVLLPVSVPSHSSLMEPAARRMGERLAGLTLRAPDVTYYSAVDAAVHSEPEDIRALLATQLARPVRWTDTVRAILASNVQALIECGPGKVLTGLNRRIERRANLQCLALEDPAGVTAALAALAGDAHARE